MGPMRRTLLYNVYNLAFTGLESRYSMLLTAMESRYSNVFETLRRCIVVSTLRGMTQNILIFRGIIQLNLQWQNHT